MNKELIARFADFLETKITDAEFNFESLITTMDENRCGTICCAAGWLPRFDPESWQWTNFNMVYRYFPGYDIKDGLIDYFGMDRPTIRDIFYNAEDEDGLNYYEKPSVDVLRHDVIDALRDLIK